MIAAIHPEDRADDLRYSIAHNQDLLAWRRREVVKHEQSIAELKVMIARDEAELSAATSTAQGEPAAVAEGEASE